MLFITLAAICRGGVAPCTGPDESSMEEAWELVALIDRRRICKPDGVENSRREETEAMFCRATCQWEEPS